MAYSSIGAIRSLLPEHVRMMALTATATQATFRLVTARLAMQNVKLIGASPRKENIHFSVVSMGNIEEFSTEIALDLRRMKRPIQKPLYSAGNTSIAPRCSPW